MPTSEDEEQYDRAQLQFLSWLCFVTGALSVVGFALAIFLPVGTFIKG